MGNGMNKIIPGLYIGSLKDARDIEQISANKISHIVSIHDSARKEFKNMKYKCIKISDSPGTNISKHFKKCIKFIHKARLKGGNVLVHCVAGVSRSCTICAVYLVTIAPQVDWIQAVAVIHAARKDVNPNDGFKKQLKQYHTTDVEKVREKLVKKYGSLNIDEQQLILSILQT